MLIFRDPNLFGEYIYSKILVLLFFKRGILQGEPVRQFSRTVVFSAFMWLRIKVGFMRKD